MVQTEQVRAELLAYAPQGVAPGAQVWLGLQLQHQPQWHTYWKNPGDSGLPTTLAWTLPPGVMAGDIAWPTPHKIAIGSLANLGFEGTVLLPVPLTIAPDFRPSGLSQDLEVRVSASWLVCRQECIPQEGEFALRLPLRGSTALHRASFEAAWAAAPKPFTGAVQATVSDTGMALRVSGLPASWRGKAIHAFPETHELLNTPTLPSDGDAVTSGTATQAGSQGWQDGVWTAQVQHSAQRYTSPTTVAWVLVQGKEGLRAEAAVQGSWPATATRAEVPAALQAALAANAQQAQSNAAVPGGLLWVLATALLGGLILNLMPCVFPVLAIKVLGFAAQSGQSRAAQRAQGLAYTAGVVLSFLALGGLLLALRAGGEQLGWGFQLQTPGVIVALALLFTLIALNLAGWLRVGSVLPQRLATLQLRHPVAEAFLSGVLAVAVASPCTAPFMGASLGYAITLPGAQALAIFAALGLGLALPYLLASWVPAVARWLPKPGAWMDTLRHFLAFPMAATVVWLVWVLGHLSGVDGAGSLLLLILGVCMLVWSLNLKGRSRTFLASISIAACALFAWAGGQYLSGSADAKVETSASATSADGWRTWAPESVQAALAQGQPVFVDFTAAWCITCQVNKKTTLNNADVQADFAAKRVTLLRADWTRRDPAITQALQALGRSGVPVYVLYAPGKAPVVLSEILTPGELRRAIATL